MLDHTDQICSLLYNTSSLVDPTSATYPPLQHLYDHFDARLFQNRLRQRRCMLTLRNHGRAHAYYWPRRFVTADGEVTDEIALNPRGIHTRPLTDNMASFAHEMVHHEQHLFGKPSRNGYHNREWGGMMKRVGLYPSDTGEPGGRETGQQMTHYLIPGGPYNVACQELLAEGFTLLWGEVEARRPTKRAARPITPAPGYRQLHL